MGSVFQPVLAAIAGAMFLKERVTSKEKTGLSIALFGSLVITFEPLLNGSSQHLGSILGNLLLIASRLTDTASTILAKTILRLKISPIALTHISFITGLFTIIPVILLFHTPQQVFSSLTSAPLSAHLGVVYMSLLSGTLAYTLFHMAEKTIEISEVTLSYYLHPVFSAPLSFFWLKEPITPAFIVGCLIVAFGVIVAGKKSSPTKT
jgi:drug/metabolite transporter (DMT)-like permease